MIYFDASASSPLSETAKNALIGEIEYFANPSSLHRLGFEAERRLKAARCAVAATLAAEPDEIVFTSGGTESDNLGILGAAHALARRGKTILATDSEHPAAQECLKALEKEGFTIRLLSTRAGALDEKEIEAAASADTILAVVMHTNNETGAVYDVKSVSEIVKKKNPAALVFCDAVQGYLKGEVDPRRLGADLISLSAHKVHGPKGVGALYVKKGVRLIPRALGGGQEKGLRSGTENLPGVVSFAAAAEEGYRNLAENRARMNRIRSLILDGAAALDGVSVNVPQNPACHIVSLQVKGFRSEVLLHTLSQRDVFVSSGSACSSHKGKSPVLKNFGLSDAEADRTVRLSFSSLNTEEEARAFLNILKEIL